MLARVDLLLNLQKVGYYTDYNVSYTIPRIVKNATALKSDQDYQLLLKNVSKTSKHEAHVSISQKVCHYILPLFILIYYFLFNKKELRARQNTTRNAENELLSEGDAEVSDAGTVNDAEPAQKKGKKAKTKVSAISTLETHITSNI